MKRLVVCLFLLMGCGSEHSYNYYYSSPDQPPPEMWQDVHYGETGPSWVSTWVDWELREERMLALPPKFLTELENADRQPFALLQIDSAGVSDEATTEAHWGANVSAANVDYTSTPPAAGDVTLAQNTGGSLVSGTDYYATSDSDANNCGPVPIDGIFYDKVDDDPHDSATTQLDTGAVGGYCDLVSDGESILSSIPSNAVPYQVSILVV
ncbi:MAG: hypothetical protein P1S46_12330, partial [bacterium]|nr:hypothetical protein [bacterium]